MIVEEKKYWDKEWTKRIDGDDVSGNRNKYVKIMNFLWNKPYLFDKEKLDVGCGPAHHAIALSGLLKNFKETWTGIDLSESAVAYARNKDMNAHVENFLTWDTDKRYQVFLFLDSLEHFENLEPVAEKVRELSAERFTIVGNVPLFWQELDGGGVEMPININIVKLFLSACGCNKYEYSVYDTSGWPFMLFEGAKI